MIFAVSLSTPLTEADSIHLLMRPIPSGICQTNYKIVKDGNRTFYAWQLNEVKEHDENANVCGIFDIIFLRRMIVNDNDDN